MSIVTRIDSGIHFFKSSRESMLEVKNAWIFPSLTTREPSSLTTMTKGQFTASVIYRCPVFRVAGSRWQVKRVRVKARKKKPTWKLESCDIKNLNKMCRL